MCSKGRQARQARQAAPPGRSPPILLRRFLKENLGLTALFKEKLDSDLRQGIQLEKIPFGEIQFGPNQFAPTFNVSDIHFGRQASSGIAF